MEWKQFRTALLSLKTFSGEKQIHTESNLDLLPKADSPHVLYT